MYRRGLLWGLVALGAMGLHNTALADRADVLSDGAVAHELAIGTASWSQRDNASYLIPRVRMGLAAGYEIGVSGHLRQEGDHQGLRHIGWEAAFPLRAEHGSRMALGLHGTVAMDDAEGGIGSGRHGLGVELRMADELFDGHGRVGGTLGLSRSDQVRGVEAPGYGQSSRLHYDASYEQTVWQRLSVGVEAAVAIGLSGDEVQNRFGMALRPGLRYDTAGGTTLRASVGRDLPGRGIEPENTVRLSISHRPAPPPSRVAMAARIAELEQARTALEHNQAQQRQRLEQQHAVQDEQGRRLEAVRQRAGTLTVEVVNTSGIAGLGEAMAERLLRKGHHTVRVVPAAPGDEVRDITYIRYRPGLADEAVSLGHSIRHIQIVTQERELPDGTEIRILVGRDQANNEGGE